MRSDTVTDTFSSHIVRLELIVSSAHRLSVASRASKSLGTLAWAQRCHSAPMRARTAQHLWCSLSRPARSASRAPWGDHLRELASSQLQECEPSPSFILLVQGACPNSWRATETRGALRARMTLPRIVMVQCGARTSKPCETKRNACVPAGSGKGRRKEKERKALVGSSSLFQR